MFASLTLAGAPAGNGTHRLATSAAAARTSRAVLAGPNGAGKSTILRAAMALLFGGPLPGASVTATTHSGRTIEATDGKARRYVVVEKDGAQKTCSGFVDALDTWAPALRLLGAVESAKTAHRHPGRLIFLPGSDPEGWYACTPAELANLATDLLPPADLVARIKAIVGDAFDPTLLVAKVPPIDPTFARLLVDDLQRAQRDANAAKERAAGAATQAEAALVNLRAEVVEDPVDEAAVAAAQTIVATEGAWVTHDADTGRYAADKAAWTKAREARDAHRAAVAKLGKRPEASPGDLQAARMRLDNARKAVREAEAARDREIEVARLQALGQPKPSSAEPAGSVPCPTCNGAGVVPAKAA